MTPNRYDNYQYKNEYYSDKNAEKGNREYRSRSVSSEWDRKSFRSNNSRKSEKRWVPKKDVATPKVGRKSGETPKRLPEERTGEETRNRNDPQDPRQKRRESGIPEGGRVDHKKDNEHIGNRRAEKRTKWALIAHQEIEP